MHEAMGAGSPYVNGGDEWNPAPRRPGGDPAPPRRRGAQDVRGTARAVDVRSEAPLNQNASVQVLTFRVERYDAHGNRVPPILVELRGASLEGRLADGDEVQVSGRWRGGLLVAKEVLSLTTGATVRARSIPMWVTLLVVLAFLAYMGFIVTMILRSGLA